MLRQGPKNELAALHPRSSLLNPIPKKKHSTLMQKMMCPFQITRQILRVGFGSAKGVWKACAPGHRKLSVRTIQHHKKLERDQASREAKEDARLGLKSTTLLGFFARKKQPTPTHPQTEPQEIIEVPGDDSGSDAMELDRDDAPPDSDEIPEAARGTSAPASMASSPSQRLTIEEVDDDEDGNGRCPDPADLSPLEQAEEGLDDIWDPSECRLLGDRMGERAENAPGTDEQPRIHGPSPFPPWLRNSDATFFPDQSHGLVLPERRKKLPRPIPSNESVDRAIPKLQELLHPHCSKGRGHAKSKLDLVTHARLECVVRFLRLFRACGYTNWLEESESIVKSCGKQGTKTWMAKKVREWAIDFCEDEKKLPTHMYGQFDTSVLTRDEDIAGSIHQHLQSLGKWASAKQIVQYVATPEFQARLRVKCGISERTAQRWMRKNGYRWRQEKKGQYSDGHERADVVHFRQHIFLPRWKELEAGTRWWKVGDSDEQISHDAALRAYLSPSVDARVVVIWRHDESTFYANDRRHYSQTGN
ncbi:unnamed protein product [Mycena citricolor]|uniref:Transposase n=1 Tax=Mycena citricolor TaxID=2018698 RepID=A0AAD2H4G0_9AGAR|nr:unnamed protein product [Mycena citricolor]